MKTPRAFALAALLSATTAFGQLTAIGTNTGVVTVFDAQILAQDLYITVINDLGGSVTGTLTAFGFNTPWDTPLDLDLITISYQVLLGSGPTTDWNLLTGAALNASGLSLTTDLAAESDANGTPNGNDPNNGVAAGEVVRFRFTFDASYSLADYAGTDSEGYPLHPLFFNQTAGPDFFARWQDVVGSTAGTSDAAALDWPPGGYDTPQGPVPEPATYGLVATLVLLCAILRMDLRAKRRA